MSASIPPIPSESQAKRKAETDLDDDCNRHQKRPASKTDDSDHSDHNDKTEADIGAHTDGHEPEYEPEHDNEDSTAEGLGDAEPAPSQPVSKNQLKRMRRMQRWEELREDRKLKRKDKRHEKQARKREERVAREAATAAATSAEQDGTARPAPAEVPTPNEPDSGDSLAPAPAARPTPHHRVVPVTILIDCDFDKYMRDTEIISLSGQVIRCYSQNRQGRYQTHMLITSFGGRMRERFNTTLKKQHEGWKGVRFTEQHFCEAAKEAAKLMRGPRGGDLVDVIKPVEEGAGEKVGQMKPDGERDQKAEAPGTEGNGASKSGEDADEEETWDRSVVYLTADSPHTLDRLEAYTSYVIGGLVDRNREKGLCYRRAKEGRVRTAKLPIGKYMDMSSRQVLTTNQVVEIMVNWLECGDWKEAFFKNIPKRKGGKLKQSPAGQDREEEGEDGKDGQVVEDGQSEDKDGDEPAASKEGGHVNTGKDEEVGSGQANAVVSPGEPANGSLEAV